MSDSESLNAAKDRILAAIHTRSWQRFRKVCFPTIAIEEYWQLYSVYLDRKHKDIIESGALFPVVDRPPQNKDVAYVIGSRIDMEKPPSQETLTAFHVFCGYVINALETNKSMGNAWIAVEQETGGAEYRALCGTAITGKVASNLHWWIQLENHQGRWKVRRLVLEGH